MDWDKTIKHHFIVMSRSSWDFETNLGIVLSTIDCACNGWDVPPITSQDVQTVMFETIVITSVLNHPQNNCRTFRAIEHSFIYLFLKAKSTLSRPWQMYVFYGCDVPTMTGQDVPIMTFGTINKGWINKNTNFVFAISQLVFIETLKFLCLPSPIRA